MHKNIIDCCANCKHCLEYPRGNRYGDIDYMCAINGYYLRSINKDISKIKRLTPGGRELECRYERKKTI